jgi:hypothetical protein
MEGLRVFTSGWHNTKVLRAVHIVKGPEIRHNVLEVHSWSIDRVSYLIFRTFGSNFTFRHGSTKTQEQVV